MTDIKEPINTTSDGTFLSVVCESPEKCCWPKVGGPQPPSPPRNYPLIRGRELNKGAEKSRKYGIDDVHNVCNLHVGRDTTVQ